MRSLSVALLVSVIACGSRVGAPVTSLASAPPATGTVGAAMVPAAPSAASLPRCIEQGNEVRYASGGTTVRGTLMRPSGSGPFPAALVLHTSGGPNAHVLAQATFLASQGFVTYAPDYFAPTGVTAASYERQTFIARYSDTVRDVLVDAIVCLRERSDVDRGRVGVVGFSLGGYFAAVLAARDDVTAAVAWYAAYAGSPVNQVPAQHAWTEIAAAAKRPLLLLHGDADQNVRVEFARRAQAELERLGKRSELVVYPGVGHGYDQLGAAQYVFDAAATADSWSRTLALLRAAR